MGSLVRRLLLISVQLVVVVAGFLPGWVANDVLSAESTNVTKNLNKIKKALNQIDRNVEEWGRASISGFVLIDNLAVNGGQGFFNLNYNQPAEFYMDQVRQNVQGAAATLVQKTVTGQLQVQMTQNQISLAPTPPKSTNSPPPATNSPATSTTSAATSTNAVAPALPNVPAPSATNGGPSGYLSLLSQADSSPQLSQNDVLKVGATDKETERVLNFMSDPLNLPNNQRAYLAVMQVGISPGWRTKKGYVGEVQLNFRYGAPTVEKRKQKLMELANKRGKPPTTRDGTPITPQMLEDEDMEPYDPLIKALGFQDRYPGVLSIFPFADAQALDFRSSLQKQLNLLVQVSSSLQTVSPKLQAQLLASYQNLTRQDSASRNLLPLVVPSSRGSDVTYRFDPEFQALEQPGNPASGPGHVLEPSSFPALIVLVCDEGEVMDYKEVVSTTETRWLPAERRSWWKHWFYDPLAYPWSRPGSPLQDEERFRTASNLDLIENELKAIHGAYTGPSAVYSEAWRRLSNLKTFAVGRIDHNTLPAVTPVVTAVYPASFRRDFMPPKITVFCRYVVDADDCRTDRRFRLKKVTLGGVVMEGCQLGGEHLIEVPLPGDRRDRFQPGSYNLEVVNAEGSTILSNAVTVSPVPAPVITGVFPTNLQETATTPPGLPSPADKLLIEPETLTITGGNLFVGDQSLRVVIGGAALTEATCKTTNLPTSVSIDRHDTFLRLDLTANCLSKLKTGKYNVVVVTSGGESVLTNALVIAPKKIVPGPHALTVVSVHPAEGNLYSTTTISIVGSNFDGMIGGTYFQANQAGGNTGAVVGRVTVGGVNCSFEYLVTQEPGCICPTTIGDLFHQ